jgi:hypothetical protein
MTRPPGYLFKKTMTGQGVSKAILDIAVWRDPQQPDDVWVAALDKLDRLGDKTALTALLRCDTALPNTARAYLADLIERGVSKPKKGGRPRTPAYLMSEKEAVKLLACQMARERVKQGRSVNEAVDDAYAHYGSWDAKLTPEKIRNSYDGKSGGSNRKQGTPARRYYRPKG